ncbi:MAG: ABC transporter permease [Acidobacteriaceae bacterium]
MTSLWADLRYAFRQLRKSPGFTVTAVLTLALGIGATTAIFSLIQAVLLHPAGIGDPARVVALRARYTHLNLANIGISVPDFADARSLKNQVEYAALEQSASFNSMVDGRTEHVASANVSWQWFNALGARPILGRTFTSDEDQPHADHEVVLSYGVWERAFGGQKDAIGKTILLDQQAYRVIGVMRSDFDWPRGRDVWVPLALAPDAYGPDQRFDERYNGIARLQPGVNVAQLNSGLQSKMQEVFRKNRYSQESGWGMFAVPYTELVAGQLRTPLYVLLGVVLAILLIACANVAGLFLARGAARSREMVIRTAFGAPAWRLVRQLLVETLLLAGTATLLGVLIGPPFGRLLLWMVPRDLAAGFDVSTAPAVLAFAAAAGLLTAVISGLAPALRIVRGHKQLRLHEGVRNATVSAERQRLRAVLVITEVALSLLLLTGTGLFLSSLRQLQQVNPGFESKGVLSGTVNLGGARYQDNKDRQASFVTAVTDQLVAQPGVQAAAAVYPVPFASGGNMESGSFGIEGYFQGSNTPGPHSYRAWVTPGYLQVMRIPLLAGRWFTPEDRKDTEPVVVIDENLAKRYWPGQSAIGQHVRFSSRFGSISAWREVVGVVGHVRLSSLAEDTGKGIMYAPYAQSPVPMAIFVVRTDQDPYALRNTLQRSVAAIDPTQTVFNIDTLHSLVQESLTGRRLIVWLLSGFAFLALILAIIGIYGLISYTAAQRTTEIGIRMALGAERVQIVAMVLQSAAKLMAAGLFLGIVLSVLARSLLIRLFANLDAASFLSFSLPVLALATAGLLAALIPALRAASVDPMQALRSE